MTDFCLIGPVYEMMKRCDLNEQPDGSFNFFPAIHDAVHRAKDNMVPIAVITEISTKDIPFGNIIAPSTGFYRTISISN